MGSEMDLKTYLLPLSTQARDALAVKCETSRGHLQNVAFYGKPCSAKLAALLELHTEQVTRKEMRPKDYWLIWPDLPAPTRSQRAQRALAKAS
jgi:hypothetical protein